MGLGRIDNIEIWCMIHTSLATTTMRFLYHDPNKIPLRRALRERQTLPEGLLWHELKAHRFHGLKWRRQVSIGRYVVDFYCRELHPVLEVDGGQHFQPAAIIYDNERTIFLEAAGNTVIRFTNLDVLKNLAGVMERLEQVYLTSQPRRFLGPPSQVIRPDSPPPEEGDWSSRPPNSSNNPPSQEGGQRRCAGREVQENDRAAR